MSQATVTKIMDGAKNAVFHVYIEGTGAGELDEEIIVDPETSFDPALYPVPTLTIVKMWYDLTGFDASLRFDYLESDTPVWTMTGDNGVELDFNEFGGLKDRSNPLDGLGKIKLSTFGLGLGDVGTFILRLRKD